MKKMANIWQETFQMIFSCQEILIKISLKFVSKGPIDQSHIITAIWWPLGVAVVSVTYMRVRWVSHTWKYTQWNIFLFESVLSSDKSPYWTNPYHIGFRYEASLNFHTYFGQCPSDIYSLLHIPLSCLSKLPAHGASDCHGPQRPPGGFSSIANGLLTITQHCFR